MILRVIKKLLGITPSPKVWSAWRKYSGPHNQWYKVHEGYFTRRSGAERQIRHHGTVNMDDLGPGKYKIISEKFPIKDKTTIRNL
tara:strand:+ start:656 stop:910 length:255 start_codon:yes stop_codon:yes gene_type:complete